MGENLPNSEIECCTAVTDNNKTKKKVNKIYLIRNRE